jgi:hypothetical protein
MCEWLHAGDARARRIGLQAERARAGSSQLASAGNQRVISL